MSKIPQMVSFVKFLLTGGKPIAKLGFSEPNTNEQKHCGTRFYRKVVGEKKNLYCKFAVNKPATKLPRVKKN